MAKSPTIFDHDWEAEVRFASAILFFSMLICSVGAAQADKRVALVIGNSAYKNAPVLLNPKNDAEDIAKSLRDLDFFTIVATDLDRAGMNDALDRFSRAVRGADIALVYYSGHGMQFGGKNYLLPVEAQLESADDVNRFRLMPLDDVFDVLQSARGARIVMLDACRNNPVEVDIKRRLASTSGANRDAYLTRGLSRVTANGLIVAYATQADDVAADGTGRNSPFAAALLRNMGSPGLDVRQMFFNVQDEVDRLTAGKQRPELSISLVGQYKLRPETEATANITSADFEAAATVDTVTGWDQFLNRHPQGFYAELARERKARIQAKLATLSLPSDRSEQNQVPLDLAMALQTELRRVGCNSGAVDGTWNAASEQALGLFNKHTGMRLEVKSVTTDTLGVVKSKAGRVCPLSCDHGYKADGEICVKIVCETGTHLSTDNSCERDSRTNIRKEGTRPPRSSASTGEAAPSGHIRRAEQAQMSGSYRLCMGPLPGCYERAIKKMTPEVARTWCTRKPSC
jgi:hypothetical protein